MFDVATGVLLVHGRHAVAHGHALAEGQMDAQGELGQQLRLAGQDQQQRVLGVHLEVEQDAQLVE